MAALIDVTGRKFDRLTIIKRDGSNRKGQALWLCQCDCGNLTTVTGVRLKSGHTRSCGCLQRESASRTFTALGHLYGPIQGPANATHGHSPNTGWSPTYISWNSMKARCSEKADKAHVPYYVGRGITVCDRWLNSFENFLADMGERPEGKSLDRIDPDGNYEPGNCRWATASEQRRNQRRNRRDSR